MMKKNSMQNSLFNQSSQKNIDKINLNKTDEWTNSETLMNEFQSLGFYMSDHPLKIYEKYFNQSKIISFDEFINNKETNGIISGTIMSIQEKKKFKR